MASAHPSFSGVPCLWICRYFIFNRQALCPVLYLQHAFLYFSCTTNAVCDYSPKKIEKDVEYFWSGIFGLLCCLFLLPLYSATNETRIGQQQSNTDHLSGVRFNSEKLLMLF